MTQCRPIEKACALTKVAEDREQEGNGRDGESSRRSGPAVGPGLGEEGGGGWLAGAGWRLMLAVQGIAPGGDDFVVLHFRVWPSGDQRG
jgi:hypothetical protein